MKTSIDFRFHLIRNVAMRPQEDFFAHTCSGGPSVDSVIEAAAVKWIMSSAETASLLLGQCGISGQITFECGVTKPFLPRAQGGDLDLLIAPVTDPRLAVSFQVKRFKATLGSDGDAVYLDEKKLADLARQCNDSSRLGFHMTYGVVLIMIDGHRSEAASVLHRGVSGINFRRVYQAVQSRSIEPRVGMMFVEIAQPTLASIDEYGFIAVGIDRHASPVEQTGDYSAIVANWSDRRRKRGSTCCVNLPPLSKAFATVGPNDAIGAQFVRRNGANGVRRS